MASLYCSPDLDRPSMTGLAEPSLRAWQRYANFSVSEKAARSCTVMLNCSQKVLQFKIVPSNVGTSSFGSLTPLESLTDEEDVDERE